MTRRTAGEPNGPPRAPKASGSPSSPAGSRHQCRCRAGRGVEGSLLGSIEGRRSGRPFETDGPPRSGEGGQGDPDGDDEVRGRRGDEEPDEERDKERSGGTRGDGIERDGRPCRFSGGWHGAPASRPVQRAVELQQPSADPFVGLQGTAHDFHAAEDILPESLFERGTEGGIVDQHVDSQFPGSDA